MHCNMKKILKFYHKMMKKICIKKNVLKELVKELDNIEEFDLSKDLANRIKDKINKLLISSSLYKNDYLVKIDITSNKNYSSSLINEYNKLSDYDKICFIIIKNFPQNIVIKVPYTEFYINYYNKDINKI